jgi:hypothetical protein
VYHVTQTVMHKTEDLWKVIRIVIGLMWFSLVCLGTHSFSFKAIQRFKSLRSVKTHITGCFMFRLWSFGL